MHLPTQTHYNQHASLYAREYCWEKPALSEHSEAVEMVAQGELRVGELWFSNHA